MRSRSAATLLLAALAVAGCADDADPGADPAATATEPGAATTAATALDPVGVTDLAAISRVEWQLVAYTEGDGPEVFVPPDLQAVVRFDGGGGYTFDGCNQQQGSVELTAGTLLGVVESSTLVDCSGSPQDEVDRIVAGVLIRPSTWTARVDGVEAVGTGIRARFEARTPPFPPDPNPGAQVLLEAFGDEGAEYRVSVGHGVGPSARSWFFRIAWRDAAGRPWNTRGTDAIVGSGAVEPGAPAGSTVVGSFLVVHTAGAAGVARAAHVADGTETALEVVVLDAEHVALVGVVYPMQPGVVVQWDAAGSELARSPPLTGR